RDADNDYQPVDRKTKAAKKVEPCVPFCTELLPGSGTPREQLAAWVTNRNNPNLARATVNRLWALFFGRPLSEPVDDLSAASEIHPALGQLADDFASHGFDLHRLIRVLAAAEVFRLDSAAEHAREGHEDAWAVFPITPLRPDQVAGALFQATSL